MKLKQIYYGYKDQSQKYNVRAEDVSQLVECLPMCKKPWVRFPAPHKSAMVVHACNFSRRERRGDQSYKVNLSYTSNSKTAWVTGDTVLKNNNKIVIMFRGNEGRAGKRLLADPIYVDFKHIQNSTSYFSRSCLF